MKLKAGLLSMMLWAGSSFAQVIPIPPPLVTLGSEQSSVDLSVWQGTINQRSGQAFSAPTNEFSQSQQCVGTPTQATGPYEKACLIIEGVQNDPSGYASNPLNDVTKDLVGIHSGMDISPTNLTGRVWGGYFQAGARAGGDGTMAGIEVGLSNFGTDQPLFNTVTSKTGLLVVAGEAQGNLPGTVAVAVVGGQSQWHNAFVAYQDAFVAHSDRAFAVRAVTNGVENWPFVVSATGDVESNSDTPHHLFPPFLNQPTRPVLAPGEAVIWGNTSTGVTSFLFYNGAVYLGAPLTTVD